MYYQHVVLTYMCLSNTIQTFKRCPAVSNGNLNSLPHISLFTSNRSVFVFHLLSSDGMLRRATKKIKYIIRHSSTSNDWHRRNRCRHLQVLHCCCRSGICSTRYMVRRAEVMVRQPTAIIRNQRICQSLGLDATPPMHANDLICSCTVLCRNDAAGNHPEWKKKIE